MEKSKNITSITTILLLAFSLLASSTLLAVGLLGSSARSKPTSVLLQAGLYAEEIEGDLDAAIKIYEQVITQAKAAEQTAAQTTYRLGMCYLKKGEKQKAAEQFQNLVSKFPQQDSLVTKAREQLAKLRPPVISAAALEQGLVAHWKFDEGRGSRAYDSAGSNDGTIHGAQWTGGRVNGALYFDSRDDYVSISPVVLSTNWTVSAWCQPLRNEVGGCNPIMGGPEDYDNYIILCEAKHHINLETDTEGDWVIVGKGAVDFNEWAYYTVTRNGNTVSAYKNGVYIDDATLPKGDENTITKIGSGYGCQTYYKGRIDDVRIHNRALSKQEVRSLYRSIVGSAPDERAPGFGPVAEVELSDIDESPQAALIDFDTGKVVEIPDRLREAGGDEAFPWVAERGLDVGAEFAGDEFGLFGIDVVATRIASERWDKITPVELHKGLAAEPMGVERDERATMMLAKGEYLPTFAFRTREGGAGVLQIVDADRSEKTINLRYKMLRPEVGKPLVKLELTKPVYEWWRAEPKVTKTIYENSQLEIEWDVRFDSGIRKRIKNFTVGVLPIREDISDVRAHYYFEDNLAFTARRTPYGKEWHVRMRIAGVSPKTLRPGEYRVYVCAFDKYNHGVGWSSRLAGVIGAGTAKLVVKPRPFTGAAHVRQVFLPDADTPSVNVVLDLASGELLPAGTGKEQLTVFREMGKGDLVYDRAFICIRGGKAKLLRADKLTNLKIKGQVEDSTAYELPSLPCSLVVTTSEGDNYEVTVMSADNSGANLEYKKMLAEPAPIAPVAGFGPVAPVEAGKRKVFLPECDTTTYDLLDLASGKIINSEPGGEMLDIGDPHGKGNLYFDRNSKGHWLASVRGTRMQLRTDGGLSSPEPELLSRRIAAYYVLPEIPCQYLVTTAGGDRYELKVLSIETDDKPGVHIEYWKSAEAEKYQKVMQKNREGELKFQQNLRQKSGEQLSGLGKAVVMYANDNNGKMPAALQELKPYLGGEDLRWLIENVRYFGKGQERERPDTPIAYDKTLLEKGNGTNVLFSDGHMGFLTPEELKKPVKFPKSG